MNERTLAQARAMVPLLQEIARELHGRNAALRKLQQDEPGVVETNASTRRSEMALEHERRRACLDEIDALGATLEQESPITIHIPITLHGRSEIACWVTGESALNHYHPRDGNEGSARQPLPDIDA